MKTKLIQKIKEDFEVRFRHYDVWQENGETKGVTVNDIFSDELWNFIESAISQSKEELVDKVIELSSKYWIDKYVGMETPLIVNKKQFKKFILEDLSNR